MRYFSNNITEVIEIRKNGIYNPSTSEGVDSLSIVARHLCGFFDRSQQEVFIELVVAIEHGRGDLNAYLKASRLPPSEADALWCVVRVILSTDGFQGKYRGVARSQGVLCDLNCGLAILAILAVDYEGLACDPDIRKSAFY